MRRTRTMIHYLVLLLLVFAAVTMRVSEAKKNKRAVSIPDDLDDVVDDEEDEAWKEWGRTKRSNADDLKPSDLSKMEMSEIQAEMMKRHRGPTYGFVKLRLGVSRTKEEVPMIAMRWSKVLRTGAIEVKFMAVDLSTIMFTIERGQDIEELKEFVLSQPEAYEMKIGEQVYRRPGDPPLEEVIEMLHKKNGGDGDRNSDDNPDHPADEL